MRTEALAKPEVGDFLSKHFVSVYDKVGTFEVSVASDGKTPNKNGGNVAAFFCTPNGQVIHVAAGPRTAEAFLAEAKWAKTVYAEILADRSLGAMQARADHGSRMAAALRQAHASALRLLSEPKATGPHVELVRHTPASDSKLQGLEAAGRRQRQQVHALLQTKSYEPIAVIGPEVYSHILGEKVTRDPVKLTGATEAKQVGTAKNLAEFFSDGGSASGNAPPAEDPAKTTTAAPRPSSSKPPPGKR